MKIGKRSKHWPFVSTEQQIEGLKFITKQFSIRAFGRSLNVFVANKMMNKSKRSVLLKRYREIAGISYDSWRRSR